jgi:hypothetical protein
VCLCVCVSVCLCVCVSVCLCVCCLLSVVCCLFTPNTASIEVKQQQHKTSLLFSSSHRARAFPIMSDEGTELVRHGGISVASKDRFYADVSGIVVCGVECEVSDTNRLDTKRSLPASDIVGKWAIVSFTMCSAPVTICSRAATIADACCFISMALAISGAYCNNPPKQHANHGTAQRHRKRALNNTVTQHRSCADKAHNPDYPQRLGHSPSYPCLHHHKSLNLHAEHRRVELQFGDHARAQLLRLRANVLARLTHERQRTARLSNDVLRHVVQHRQAADTVRLVPKRTPALTDCSRKNWTRRPKMSVFM